MADKAVALLEKPQMRGLLHNQIKKNIIGAFICAVAGGLIFKFTVADPRKRKYAEFYRTYDAEAAFEEMKKKGLFQSC